MAKKTLVLHQKGLSTAQTCVVDEGKAEAALEYVRSTGRPTALEGVRGEKLYITEAVLKDFDVYFLEDK